MKILLSEDYNLINEFNLLAKDIIDEFLNQNDRWVDKILNDSEPNIFKKYVISIFTPSNFIDISKYNNLKNFIENNHLDVIFDKNFDGSSYISSYKTIQLKFPSTNCNICTYHDIFKIKDINQLKQEIYNEILNVLVHELRHAYDHFIQKDNFTKYKRRDLKKIQQKAFDTKNLEYWQIPHEYWARFTAAITQAENPKETDLKDFIHEVLDLIYVDDLFIKDKKRIIKAIINYYYEAIQT